MSDCSKCSHKSTCNSKSDAGCSKLLPKYGNVKKVVAIMSGKGGVGKSTVTGMVATMMNKRGYKVGVLDADITGPSMPRFFGINERRADILVAPDETAIYVPVETDSGIKVMSMNLLMQGEDEPVIWRGPVVTGVLSQMYTDTKWGEIDYLVIDMPPGTSDVTLTIMQSFPLAEIIIVSTPQDMVSMIVKKVVNMANRMNIKIRGVVENMAYIQCDGCTKKIRVFSRKSAEEHAEYLDLPLIGELPINIDLSENLEKGNAEDYIRNNDLYSLIFEGLY